MNPNDATWSGPHRLRTSDKEREQVAEILRAAMTEGRLTLEEGEERLAAAYAAKFRDELGPLTADLPDGGRQALADTPQARAAHRRGVRRHTAAVIAIAAVLGLLLLLPGPHHFWPIIPLAFLFLALRRHSRYAHYQHQYHYAHRVAPWNAPDYR